MPDLLDQLKAALADRYTIERELGQGGMATVYLARDLRHDRDVALKVLRPELAAILGAERFLQEIRISARLDHPHILTLIDSGESDGFLYYVLPFVRGESLRAKLEREKQLGLDEVLVIAKQIAGALDYAHQHGVVHRDIKPENILLHEGEAMLADFGIALAVKEAGGNRLTETGLSLGTPQYMSPEQATGDRQLDARSDIYSLGAVVYEMLAGEPPVTGPTVQAVIAKLMTERPTRLRTVRDAVPQGTDDAVAKALAKVPADRFPHAGDFAAALARGAEPSSAASPRRRRWAWPAAAFVLVVIAAGLVLSRWPARARGPAFVVRDRAQVTFTGQAWAPAISADGKQLAYIVRRCERASCTYGIEVQDIVGGASRRVFDGATALYGVRFSPDRRFLLSAGSIARRYGAYLFSTLGGAPRYVGPGEAAFFPSGDSLLIASPPTDSVPRLWIATLDGDRRDSLVVGRPGDAIPSSDAGRNVAPMPSGPMLLAEVVSEGRSELRILDRRGRTLDTFRAGSGMVSDLVRATTDAAWVLLTPLVGGQSALVRLPVDVARGRFTGRGDTLLLLADRRIGVDVSIDGRTIAYGDGTARYDLWALDLADGLRGAFAPERRLASATTPLGMVLSPGGDRVLVLRPIPGGSQREFAVLPLAGGAEVIHRPAGLVARYSSGSASNGVWISGGASFSYAEVMDGKVRLVTADARTGARRTTFAIADSAIDDYAAVGDNGWAWIPRGGKSLRVQRPGEPASRDIPRPPGDELVFGINAAPDGAHVVTCGWDGTYDSIVVHVVGLPEGRATRWAAFFSEGCDAWGLGDGSVLVANHDTPVTYTLYHVRAPGRIERLGTIPRPVSGLSVSDDARRLAVLTGDFREDVWLARVAPAR